MLFFSSFRSHSFIQVFENVCVCGLYDYSDLIPVYIIFFRLSDTLYHHKVFTYIIFIEFCTFRCTCMSTEHLFCIQNHILKKKKNTPISVDAHQFGSDWANTISVSRIKCFIKCYESPFSFSSFFWSLHVSFKSCVEYGKTLSVANKNRISSVFIIHCKKKKKSKTIINKFGENLIRVTFGHFP